MTPEEQRERDAAVGYVEYVRALYALGATIPSVGGPHDAAIVAVVSDMLNVLRDGKHHAEHPEHPARFWTPRETAAAAAEGSDLAFLFEVPKA